MAIDFKKIDKTVDLEGLQNDIDNVSNSGDYPEIPADKYEVKIVSMEIKETKKDHRPMFTVQAKILTGEYQNQSLWMNRVIYGTKSDAGMIKSIIGFLENLDTGIAISFTGYSQFNQLVLDVMEEIESQRLEYAVDYDHDRFNSISIEEVFEPEEK